MNHYNCFHPRWVFELWAIGTGYLYCAHDSDLPINKAQRIWWIILGNVMTFLFGWWRTR